MRLAHLVRLAAAALALGLVAGCAGTTEQVEVDHAIYPSIEELADEADLVAVVEVGQVLSREVDDGGSDDPDDGIAMAFWEVTVREVLKGEPPADGALVLGWPDLDQQPQAGRSTLKAGQRTLVFVHRLTTTDAPGIDTQEVFYVPLGGDNGVLDVDGDRLVPRADLDRLRIEDAPQEPFTTDLAAVRASVTG